jgi:hypothetical protein
MVPCGANTILLICFSAAWGGKVSAASLHRKPTRPHLDQVGLFLGCVSCHSSAEVLFLLNFLLAEGRCEIFGLKDLADLYVGLAFVGAALDPLDGLLERLDLPEPEGGDEFLLSAKGPSVTMGRFLPEKWTRAPLEEG